MAQAKTGDRYSVSVSIAKPGTEAKSKTDYVAYNDAAVAEFSLTFSLNRFPRGTARLVGQSADVMPPASGAYGLVIFTSMNETGVHKVYPMYIIRASRELVSANTCAIDIEFELGNIKTQSVMDNIAISGTSIEAINKLCGDVGLETIDNISKYKGDGYVADNMEWRFVEGTISQHLRTAIAHSAIPGDIASGDIAYWTFDEVSRKIVIGTFEISKTFGTKHLLMYSYDANQGIAAVARKVNGNDAYIWFYNGYLPSDISGELREARSPNLFIDTIDTNTGNKQAGRCGNECWSDILKRFGASDSGTNDGYTFSRQLVVKPFPLNTHKLYSVAPHVRRYILAGYSKKVTLNLYNNPGPTVGSCMYLYAESAVKQEGDFLPDLQYTSRYIVMSKTIRKVSTTSVGMLGKTVDTTSSDMVTELTLASNAGYSGKEYDEVIRLAEAILSSQEKDGKK